MQESNVECITCLIDQEFLEDLILEKYRLGANKIVTKDAARARNLNCNYAAYAFERSVFFRRNRNLRNRWHETKSRVHVRRNAWN